MLKSSFNLFISGAYLHMRKYTTIELAQEFMVQIVDSRLMKWNCNIFN